MVRHSSTEIHVYIADINVSRVKLFFEKDLSYKSNFLRSCMQALQIERSFFMFQTFLGFIKLQRS